MTVILKDMWHDGREDPRPWEPATCVILGQQSAISRTSSEVVSPRATTLAICHFPDVFLFDAFLNTDKWGNSEHKNCYPQARHQNPSPEHLRLSRPLGAARTQQYQFLPDICSDAAYEGLVKISRNLQLPHADFNKAAFQSQEVDVSGHILGRLECGIA